MKNILIDKKNMKEAEEEFKLPATVTNDMIAMWKSKHRKVVSITVEDDGELFTGFFRRPDMNTMSAVMAVAKTDELKASNVMFENCWLGGDELMREDFALKVAAMGKMQSLMEVKVQELKNW